MQGDCIPLGREACTALAACSERPMLFALSEPGVLTPEDAFEWMGGQVIFTDARLVRTPACISTKPKFLV